MVIGLGAERQQRHDAEIAVRPHHGPSACQFARALGNLPAASVARWRTGETMSSERPSVAAPVCLVLGALLGLAGSFAPTSSLRGVAWGLDGTLLVVAAALLAVHCLSRDLELMSAGFLVFIAGQTLVVSASAMSLEASSPVFAAGAGLWAAALVLISTPPVMPALGRVSGVIAAVLFAATALQIYSGRGLTPLSEPLPFFAYPVFVVTLLTWAWWCRRPGR